MTKTAWNVRFGSYILSQFSLQMFSFDAWGSETLLDLVNKTLTLHKYYDIRRLKVLSKILTQSDLAHVLNRICAKAVAKPCESLPPGFWVI